MAQINRKTRSNFVNARIASLGANMQEICMTAHDLLAAQRAEEQLEQQELAREEYDFALAQAENLMELEQLYEFGNWGHEPQITEVDLTTIAAANQLAA